MQLNKNPALQGNIKSLFAFIPCLPPTSPLPQCVTLPGNIPCHNRIKANPAVASLSRPQPLAKLHYTPLVLISLFLCWPLAKFHGYSFPICFLCWFTRINLFWVYRLFQGKKLTLVPYIFAIQCQMKQKLMEAKTIVDNVCSWTCFISEGLNWDT